MSTTPPQAPDRRGAPRRDPRRRARRLRRARLPRVVDRRHRARGGISKALIYEHFASKQDLYAELLEQHAGELFSALAEAISEAGHVRRPPGSPPASTPSTASSRSTASPGACCSARPPTPRPSRVLDRDHRRRSPPSSRALIAEDPGARRGEDDEATREHGVQVLAQMLVGAVQSLANWWADHQELPRELIVGDDDGLRLAGAAAPQPGRALARLPLRELRRATSSTSADPRRLALVAVARDGERREIAFGEVADRSARLAGTLAARGVGARRRGHDADRQPARVGLRDGRLLAPRGGGAALHRAAAAGRPARAHGRGRRRARWSRTSATSSCVGAAGFDGPVLVVPDEAPVRGRAGAARRSSTPRTRR